MSLAASLFALLSRKIARIWLGFASESLSRSNRETYNENHFVYKIRATRVTHTQFKAGDAMRAAFELLPPAVHPSFPVELEQKFGDSGSRILLERHGIRIVMPCRSVV